MTPEEMDALLRRAGVRPAWQGTREARPGYYQQQSPAGALRNPETVPYRRVPTRRDREFSRAALQDTAQRGAYSEPRNQIAEAGMQFMETTGAPEIARGVQSIQRNQPGEAAGHFAMGGLGLLGTASLPFGSGARAPAPPRIPRIQQAIPEAQGIPNAPPRLPGRATDGSVLPIRPREEFRQSLVGGSGDLADAAGMRPNAGQFTDEAFGPRGRRLSNDAGHIVYTPKAYGWRIDESRVARDQRGQGVGTELYEDLISRARVAGVPEVFSDVSTSPGAQGVYAALERRGYRVIREEGEHGPRFRVSTDAPGPQGGDRDLMDAARSGPDAGGGRGGRRAWDDPSTMMGRIRGWMDDQVAAAADSRRPMDAPEAPQHTSAQSLNRGAEMRGEITDEQFEQMARYARDAQSRGQLDQHLERLAENHHPDVVDEIRYRATSGNFTGYGPGEPAASDLREALQERLRPRAVPDGGPVQGGRMTSVRVGDLPTDSNYRMPWRSDDRLPVSQVPIDELQAPITTEQLIPARIRNYSLLTTEPPPLLVRRSDNVVRDGAHRLAVARAQGRTSMPVVYDDATPVGQNATSAAPDGGASGAGQGESRTGPNPPRPPPMFPGGRNR